VGRGAAEALTARLALRQAWEEKIALHQTPWCYVHDNCTLAEKKKGSFGRKHIDCTYEHTSWSTGPHLPISPLLEDS
jgi:hypothetical protein